MTQNTTLWDRYVRLRDVSQFGTYGAMDELVKEEIAREREACARLVETWVTLNLPPSKSADRMVASIRSRQGEIE